MFLFWLKAYAVEYDLYENENLELDDYIDVIEMFSG